MEGRVAHNCPYCCRRHMHSMATHSFTHAPIPLQPHWQLSALLIVLPVLVPPPKVTAPPSMAIDKLLSPCASCFTCPPFSGPPCEK